MNGVKFVHVGMGHLVQAEKVLAVIKPNTACGRRYSSTARETGKYIDATMGKGLKSLILMDEGSVVASMITMKTLRHRLNGKGYLDAGDEDDGEDAEGTE